VLMPNRCFRLKKECIVQPRLKRKSRRVLNAVYVFTSLDMIFTPRALNYWTITKIGRWIRGTTELESKIESLVNLLSAAQVAKIGLVTEEQMVPTTSRPDINEPLREFPHSNGLPREGFKLSQSIPSSVDESLSAGIGSTAPTKSRLSFYRVHCVRTATNYPEDHTPASTSSLPNSTSPPVKSPDELLQTFKHQFMVQIPYAIISPTVSAEELYDKQPWLYRVVIMISSENELHEKVEEGKLIISELSTAVRHSFS
jgi:hypothetical protein